MFRHGNNDVRSCKNYFPFLCEFKLVDVPHLGRILRLIGNEWTSDELLIMLLTVAVQYISSYVAGLWQPLHTNILSASAAVLFTLQAWTEANITMS